MIAIAKPYVVSILEWKAKKFIKAIISPVDDEDAPPKPIKHKPSGSTQQGSSTSAQPTTVTPTPTVSPTPVPPIAPKYQNPPPTHSHTSSSVAPEDFAIAIIKVACILVIGVVILNSVVMSANINSSSSFQPVFESIKNNISSGYTLAALMVLALGAGAIMHFIGFM